MRKILQQLMFIAALTFVTNITAQVTLNADGPGNTYELINSILAPGNNAVEAPDVTHSAFGRHIAEVFDATLNKNVFEFYAHLTTDDDPSTAATDRQRVEIKTYDQSPANLLGVTGETVTYKWRFKIAAGFQPSDNFTHLHQIKAVGGDDADPIFTLTARKGFAGGPNKMQLIYVENSALSSTTLQQVDLSLFEDTWVEATEKIEYGPTGKYSLVIKKVSDNSIIMSLAKIGFITIRGDNTFARPKWGIYRSIATPADLRDEAVRFSDFSITEGPASFTQTYYWTGGIGQVGALGNDFSDGTKWNTIQNGSGVSRLDVSPSKNYEDVFIVDGTNIGGSTPATGQVIVNVKGDTLGRLILQNNANILMKRATGTTGTLRIFGDGTTTPDVLVNSGCNISIINDLADGNINFELLANVTGLIYGTMEIGGTGTHRITSQTTNGLVFANGSSFTSGAMPTSNAHAFGSASQGVQHGVQFMAGASLIITGNRSPFGNTSTFQNCNLMPGSNTYFKTTNAASTGSWTNLKTYGNLFIQNSKILTSDGPLYKVDTLTIENGSTFTTHSSGNTPVLGNLVVNGTYTTPGASTNTLILGGSVPQTVSGAGTITVNNLIVANHSDVTLQRSIPVAVSTNIYGKINFGATNAITGAGTFSAKANTNVAAPVTFTGNTTAGSFQITSVTAPTGTNGLKVTGTSLAIGTNAVGFSSSNGVINISKAALTTTTGTVFTFTGDSALLVTTNVNGFSATGSIQSIGATTLSSGINVEVNAATTSPFPIETTPATYYANFGNVTFNASATTNTNIRVRGTLTLNNGITTIRPNDTIRVVLQPQIQGAPFSSTKYFATANNGTNTGFLRLDNLTTTTTLFPVGTTTNYLPVTLTPTATMSYAVNAFPGLTVDGSITGAAASGTVINESVNNTWTINRITGSGDCDVKLEWPASLEGAAFATIPDGEVSLSRYNGAIFEIPLGGLGNNTTNTANATFSAFSPFIVTKNPIGLPVTFVSVEAFALANSNEIKWKVGDEIDITNYTIEKSTNGVNFTPIGIINANRSINYSFIDANTASLTYYRIVVKGFNNYKKISAVIQVRRNAKSTISVYPNPFTESITITGQKGASVINIIAANGTKVKTFNTNANSVILDMNTLQNGTYLVEIIEQNGTKKSKTIVKQ